LMKLAFGFIALLDCSFGQLKLSTML